MMKLSQVTANNNLYQLQAYNYQDPNVWDILYLDQALPIDPVAKAYTVKDLQNWTRNYLLIPIKIFANICLALIMTIKRFLPFQFRAYTFMHNSAAFFLDNFVSPEACYLIVRHLCIGSNIINFLIDNGPDSNITKSQLYPQTVKDLAKNAFLEHDLILYNFIYDYHQAEAKNSNWLQKRRKKDLNFDSIQTVPVNIDFQAKRWFRILDLESAIELFKIFYSLCLTSDEFARAVLSLQFDENFAIYVSKVIDDTSWNHVITNRHALVPNSSFAASRNLLLHGIVTEYLHRYLEMCREKSTNPGNISF
jgi:hypothetical protein